MRLSEDEILASISEHTTMIRGGLWERQIRYNEAHTGFGMTINGIAGFGKGKPGLVVGAGPGFKRFGYGDLELIAKAEKDKIIVACDGALPTLDALGIPPTLVVSVDAHPVVANFYRRSKRLLEKHLTTAVLSTTINKDVVAACKEAGVPILWFQGFFDGHAPWHRKDVTSLVSGGNVGTTCYVLTFGVLHCKPIGLMGLEFAWSDETPLVDTQYFGELMKITNNDPKMAARLFKKVRNSRDGKTYVADPVYFAYRTMFREIWKDVPADVRQSTFNLTKEGILSAKGLKYISAQDFLEKL